MRKPRNWNIGITFAKFKIQRLHPMIPKHVLFIINPISGTRRKRSIPSLIQKHLDHTRFTHEVCFTEHAGHATEIAAQAAADGVDIVVAVGGDGTINEVARSLVHTKTALAIIPCGSGNGLARHLELPQNARGAIDIINKDTVHCLDYGMLNDHPFFCTCGMGFDAFVSMNLYNAVFVDCTASPAVAEIYHSLLDHNINVVCANKIAASSDYNNYERLKQTAHKRGVKYLFETNVGAGLPIINTINGLINSGDEILKIEAVLSGTLNYIFNTLSPDVPMSRAIAMAKEAGYAEPDPRLDLNGSDVVRKIVILSREAGYRINCEEVEKHLFLPKSLFDGTLEAFWNDVKEVDGHFEALRREAEGAGNHFRFVARFENGKASVGLEQVPQDHPFYHLEGSNNIILLTTARYREYPMCIQGYGAGAAVTAAGVFADLISVANIR